MKVRYMIVVSLVVLALIVVGCVKPTPAPEVTPEVTPEVEEFVMPEVIYMRSQGIGSSTYAILAVHADALMKKYGVKVRVIPGGTGMSRNISLRAGDIHVWAEGSAQFPAYEGMFGYADADWGPQDIRMVWISLWPGQSTLATPCDANIKTPYDLKGKRIPWVTGTPGQQLMNTAFLAFGNLTWDDVIKVEMPGWTASVKGIIEGKVDAVALPTRAPLAYEVEACPRGLCWPRMDPDDTEAWNRLWKINPYIYPAEARAPGAGLEEGKVYQVSNNGGLSYGVYASESEDFAYNLAKMINESYDLYKDQPVAERSSAEYSMYRPIGFMPYHEGTVKYLKEIGYWTAEHEAWQNEKLERGRILQAAWKAALDEAAETKMDSKDFPDFWLEKRDEVLKKAGLPVYGF